MGIKLRAWAKPYFKNEFEMLYSSAAPGLFEGIIICEDGVFQSVHDRDIPGLAYHRLEHQSIMLGSGVLDKDGKEAFQGDQIFFSWGSDIKLTKTIEFKNGKFSVDLMPFHLISVPISSIEFMIIGDIYTGSVIVG